MTKKTKDAGDNQSEPLVTIEGLSSTLQEHTSAQVETNRRFTESFVELEKNAKAMESRIEKSLEAKIEACYEKMCDRLEKKLSKSIEIGDDSPPPYRHPNYQVHHSNMEPDRSVRNEETVDRSFVVGNKDKMLKRVELPVFDGEDAYGWFALAERYFRIAGFDERSKLDVVSVSLVGDVLSWFNSETHRREFRSWKEFKEKLISRFSKEKLRDPSQPFFAVKQTGTVAQYIHVFEDLSTQVTGLTETHLEGIFMNGLQPAMREVVNMSKPVDLAEMISTAYQMEDSVLYKVVCREKQQDSRNTLRASSSKNSTQRSSTGWSYKPAPEKQVETVQQRPQVRLTEAQIAEKKRLGLCFTCDEKWSRQHWCQNRSLQVLTVINGIEMEILDQSLIEIDDEVDGTETAMMGLSLNSFLGLSSPTTTKLLGYLKKNKVIVMIDSGATHNFISPATVQKNKLSTTTNPNLSVLLGTGISVQGTGVCSNVELSLPDMSFQAEFIVLELGNVDVILGVQWLRTLGTCVVDWEKNEWSFCYQGKQVLLRGDPSLHGNVSLKTFSPERRVQKKGISMEVKSVEKMTETEEMIPSTVAQTLQQYEAVFQKPKGLPPLRGREHSIVLQDNSKPISVRPYRYPHAHKEIMEVLVREMLEEGLIRPSTSPYSSPVLLVKKKDKSHRFCVDYRAVNRATIQDKYPIPMIDQLLDELHGAQWFTKLDLRSGYHQIRMQESDIEKTAFRTHDSHYEFLVMPFGLTNAPATFQALMNDVFRKFLRKFVLVFFDDILIYSYTLEEHVKHIEMVLDVFVEQKLFANRKKCAFAQKQVEYLGHVISSAGVSTDNQKIEAVQKWPIPKAVKDLRGFLGLTGYYRKFVQHYGCIAKPLTELLKKEQFLWSTLALAAFEELKRAMVSAPVLALPDFTKLFIVESDASGFGLGAVLMQDGHPIAFFSRGLTSKEQQKPIYERELMAIVLSIQKWRHYLLGRRFVVRTDQQSLKYLLEQREITLDYQRWLTRILGYEFDIEYKVGSENKVADGLSRIDHATKAEGVTVDLLALTVPSALQLQDLYAEVDNNVEIQQLVAKLAVGKEVKCGFSLTNGRLFYKQRLVIPSTSAFIPLILQESHDSVMGGHAGVLRTLQRVKLSFYWSKMRKRVQEYVAACAICQTHKYSTLSPAGLLQPIELPNQIWEDVAMDFIEGLPTSQGVNVILVVVDRLSKYGHFMTLKHPFTAMDVAHKFGKEVIRLHGFPKSIISDRDKIFLSKFWKECFRMAGTRLRFSTAFHPQTDGQTEVLNRCVETYLRCFASSHPKTWSKFLPWAELWYNTAYHTALKCTPSQLVYGREPPTLLPYEQGASSNFEVDAMLKERDAMLGSI